MIDRKDKYAVIMCGGVGSRFWPYSRKTLPKQFFDFFGTGRTLLQQTVNRFQKVILPENILLITNRLYADLVREQLPQIKPEQILLEPSRRNTAPSVAWASYHIRAINPNASIVVTPADQLILKEEEFLNAIERGLNTVAHSDKLLTMGVKPHCPETRYGYIQIDNEVDEQLYRVKTFTEKPEIELAKVFMESGEFYWNMGIFMWHVDSITRAIEQLLPDIHAKLSGAGMEPVYGTPREQAFIDERFPTCLNTSVEYGLMEKADKVYVSVGDFGWSDLGTWSTLYDLAGKDDRGNVALDGHIQFYDSDKNMVVMPAGKLAVVAGLEGYLVAESDNALLICRRDDERTIRKFLTDAQMKWGDQFI